MKLPKKKDFKKEVFKYMLPILKRNRKERRRELLKNIKHLEKKFIRLLYKRKIVVYNWYDVERDIIALKYIAMQYGIKTENAKDYIKFSIE